MKFKAAVLRELHQPLQIEEVRLKTSLSEYQVLVRLTFSGICGKQLDEIRGKHGPDKFLPHLLGHEGVGEVLEIGPGVKKVKVSDYVLLHWMPGSGGRGTTATYITSRGEKINAGWVTTFNEMAVVAEDRVTPLAGPVNPYDSFLGCAVSTALGAVRTIRVSGGIRNIAVVGAGGVGEFLVRRLRGSDRLMVVDSSRQALERALLLGATHVFPSMGALLEAQNETSVGHGLDCVITTVSNGPLIADALRATREGGSCLVLGVPQLDDHTSLDINAIFHNRTIQGCIGGEFNPDLDLSEFRSWLQDEMTFHRVFDYPMYELSAINQALDAMKVGSPGRQLVRFPLQ